MGEILVVAEQRGGRLTGPSREVASVASRLATSLQGAARALLLGGPGTAAEAAQLGRFGVASVAVAEHEALAEYDPEPYAPLVAERARDSAFAAVLFPASTAGKDLAPRVAALLDLPLASDVTRIDVEGGRLVVERPVYAGKAFATLEIEGSPVLATLRPNAFPATERPATAEVTTFRPDLDPTHWKTRVVERRQAGGGELDVSEATVIVSGGRGMKDPSHWALLERLRNALGPGVALGASRAVVDAGWRPHAEQVGQTGKTVSPKLYIAVGISGAVQHLAGMRTAQTIVAINRDAEAPIFGVADYGIVGDLFEVVPRLAEEIEALKARSR